MEAILHGDRFGFTWRMARYRLKYCLKGPLSPKQPTNQPTTWRQPLLALVSHLVDISRSYASHSMLQILYDNLIWKYPLDLIQCIRSSYYMYCNVLKFWDT